MKDVFVGRCCVFNKDIKPFKYGHLKKIYLPVYLCVIPVSNYEFYALTVASNCFAFIIVSIIFPTRAERMQA